MPYCLTNGVPYYHSWDASLFCSLFPYPKTGNAKCRFSSVFKPVYDYCLPDKECPGGCGSDDPCQLFQNIAFPVEEFFPPNSLEIPGDYEGAKQFCSCRK